MTCPLCAGTGVVPLPRGMSPGFYLFMRVCEKRDDGASLMTCPRCDGRPDREGPKP